jgi:DNA invertase Pin-like site-specific DNA recombinase
MKSLRQLHVITDDHRSREAVVYVRQSSAGQVQENVESAQIQRRMREDAIALGWSQATIIDVDLGISASGLAERPGFRELLARVANRHVGIIFCIDASRLSRNSKDWAELFELCGHFDTLIADHNQVYDLSNPNDRMVMGIKGTVSEMELGLIRQRMRSGREAKAARGELRYLLPVGYAFDSDGRVVFHPDSRVRKAIEALFHHFDGSTSVRQLALWYCDTKTQFPGG